MNLFFKLSSAMLFSSTAFAQTLTKGTATPTTTATSTVAVGGTTSTVTTEIPEPKVIEFYFYNPEKKIDICINTGWDYSTDPKMVNSVFNEDSFCLSHDEANDSGTIYKISTPRNLKAIKERAQFWYHSFSDLDYSIAYPEENFIPILEHLIELTASNSKYLPKVDLIDYILNSAIPTANAQTLGEIIRGIAKNMGPIARKYFFKDLRSAAAKTARNAARGSVRVGRITGTGSGSLRSGTARIAVREFKVTIGGRTYPQTVRYTIWENFDGTTDIIFEELLRVIPRGPVRPPRIPGTTITTQPGLGFGF